MSRVTDADRRAAAEVFDLTGWKGVAKGMREGRYFPDDSPEMKSVALLAAHRIQARKEAIEEAAAYLDGYAGGHYMAQSCAAAIRALGEGVE